MKAVFDPDLYCPICGVKDYDGHRCSESFIRRREIGLSAVVHRKPRDQSFAQRLCEGVKMIRESGDD